MNSVIFNCHAALINCARAEGDLPACVRHLKHLLACMDVVYPENFPEKSDYLFAYAETLQELLTNRGGQLPKVSTTIVRLEWWTVMGKGPNYSGNGHGDTTATAANTTIITTTTTVTTTITNTFEDDG
jgi:hypothetical protein